MQSACVHVCVCVCVCVCVYSVRVRVPVNGWSVNVMGWVWVQREARGGAQPSLQSLQQKSKQRLNTVRVLALAVHGKGVQGSTVSTGEMPTPGSRHSSHSPAHSRASSRMHMQTQSNGRVGESEEEDRIAWSINGLGEHQTHLESAARSSLLEISSATTGEGDTSAHGTPQGTPRSVTSSIGRAPSATRPSLPSSAAAG
jgi:hypothetical protein